MQHFVDREQELQTLQAEYDRPGSALVVLYGRRRVGKTTLISEFIREKPALFFLASEESEPQNRAVFKEKTAEFLNNDLLLQRIANAITDTIPPNCLAMRVGGDEFLILCTQCSSEQAHQIVADIKKCLAERSDDKLTLSAAFGVSTSEVGKPFSFDQAYETADQDMYRDKKASRIER